MALTCVAKTSLSEAGLSMTGLSMTSLSMTALAKTGDLEATSFGYSMVGHGTRWMLAVIAGRLLEWIGFLT